LRWRWSSYYAIVLAHRIACKIARGEEDRDMALKAMRILNLLLAGVLTGNEFGGFVGFHPALYQLPTEAHARAERAITSRFGKLMPPFMTAAILSFVPVLSLVRHRRSPSFVFTLLGMLCYVAMLAVTFAGNMPVNRRMLEMDPGAVSSEELMELRRHWDRSHAARNVLNFLGFASALLGALSEDTIDQRF
jgi:uncharacterized membrane protein